MTMIIDAGHQRRFERHYDYYDFFYATYLTISLLYMTSGLNPIIQRFGNVARQHRCAKLQVAGRLDRSTETTFSALPVFGTPR